MITIRHYSLIEQANSTDSRVLEIMAYLLLLPGATAARPMLAAAQSGAPSQMPDSTDGVCTRIAIDVPRRCSHGPKATRRD